MRIVFMGTGEIALPTLRFLIADPSIELVAVFTGEDKKVGRRQQITAPEIKTVAREAGVHVFQPARIRDVGHEFPELDLDLIVVMAYGQLLPKVILEAPRIACLNLHTSLLPKYRGASPIQAAIREGDEETGVTVMCMDEGLDTGDLLLLAKLPITDEDTGGSISKGLSELAPRALGLALEMIRDGKASRNVQDHSAASHCGKLQREDGELDWSLSAEELSQTIRAYEPWPGTFTKFALPGEESKVLKIYPPAEVVPRPAIPEGTAVGMESGAILASGERLIVRTGHGFLALGAVQPAGKRKMTAREFTNGQQVRPGGFLGAKAGRVVEAPPADDSASSPKSPDKGEKPSASSTGGGFLQAPRSSSSSAISGTGAALAAGAAGVAGATAAAASANKQLPKEVTEVTAEDSSKATEKVEVKSQPEEESSKVEKPAVEKPSGVILPPPPGPIPPVVPKIDEPESPVAPLESTDGSNKVIEAEDQFKRFDEEGSRPEPAVPNVEETVVRPPSEEEEAIVISQSAAEKVAQQTDTETERKTMPPKLAGTDGRLPTPTPAREPEEPPRPITEGLVPPVEGKPVDRDDRGEYKISKELRSLERKNRLIKIFSTVGILLATIVALLFAGGKSSQGRALFDKLLGKSPSPVEGKATLGDNETGTPENGEPHSQFTSPDVKPEPVQPPKPKSDPQLEKLPEIPSRPLPEPVQPPKPKTDPQLQKLPEIPSRPLPKPSPPEDPSAGEELLVDPGLPMPDESEFASPDNESANGSAGEYPITSEAIVLPGDPASDPVDVSVARSAVLNFFARHDWEARSKLVADEARVAPLMKKYFEDGSMRPVTAKVLPEWASYRNGNIRGMAFRVGLEDGSDRLVVARKDGDHGFAVDWEALVGHGDISLQKFFDERPSEAAMLRVFMQGNPTEDGEYQLYPIQDRSGEIVGSASIHPVNQPKIAAAIIEVFEGRRIPLAPVMVRLQYLEDPSSDGGKRLCLIDFIRLGWVD